MSLSLERNETIGTGTFASAFFVMELKRIAEQSLICTWQLNINCLKHLSILGNYCVIAASTIIETWLQPFAYITLYLTQVIALIQTTDSL